MARDILIEWTTALPESGGPAEVTIFEDGRVYLSARFGGGEYRLSPDELSAVRRFVFDEQRFQTIDADGLRREVRAAAERHRAHSGPEAIFHAAPQMDSGRSCLRSEIAGNAHEVAYQDLVGDAQAYPEVEPLQRLRRIEIKILDLAERLSAGGS